MKLPYVYKPILTIAMIAGALPAAAHHSFAMLQRFLTAHAARGRPNDTAQFDLPIELLGYVGAMDDRVAGTNHAGRRLGEDHRLFGEVG